MNLRELWIVLAKELSDAARDRRALLAGLLFALLGPLVLTAALQAMIAAEREADGQAVLVVGAARAPGLLAHLAAAGLMPQPRAADPTQLLAQAPGAVVLVIPEAAPAELARGRAARLELWADLGDSTARRQAERLQRLVASYARQLADQRLLGAGVAPGTAQALALDLRDVGGQGGKAALVLGMLPVFWLLGVFVGGAHVALDATGGERERRSLEALLAQPASPGTLFTAKWLASALFGFVTAAAALLLSAVLLARLPLHELGVAFAFDAALLARLLLVLLPLALLVAALQCVLALHARSQREAQTALNLLQLAPMVLVLEGVDALPAAARLLPMLAQHAQLGVLLAGTPPLPTPLLAAAVSLAAAGLLAHAGSRRLGSERFVLGL